MWTYLACRKAGNAMLDYQTTGCSIYGASMGRKSDLPNDYEGKVTLRAVPLDQGGYDPGGAYWGTPSNLYLLSDAKGRTHYLRADDFDSARRKVARAFPKVTIETPAEVTDADIDDMLEGYMECALWSSIGDDDRPLDDTHNTSDIDDETKAEMRKDCETFARANASALLACIGHGSCDWSRAGHDLWLTRNGHGANFLDGDWPQPQARILYDAAGKMREAYLYVTDDGHVASA